VLRTLVLILALIAVPAWPASPSTCGSSDPYAKALCAYQQRRFGEAENGFRQLVDADAKDPSTIRAMYFLARTLMKTGRFGEASQMLIRIYETDKPFYDDWQCDFLLGECRRAQGKDEG
jgi:TolA-binding protein